MSIESSESFEDRVIDELLERLNDNVTPAVGTGGLESETSDEALVREYLEVLGLLPFQLEFEHSSPVLKEKIMSAVGAGSPSRDTMPRKRFDRTASSEVVVIPKHRRSGWALPLAAGLALALLGLTIWQSTRLDNQRGTIEDLAGRLHEANMQIADEAENRDGLRRAESNLALVSSPGVEVCTLHPGDAELAPRDARGTLFVAADHKSWYMRLEGLVPCPLGRKHQIWFVSSDGIAVSGGVFDVEPGEGIELTSDLMPADTVAVMITLEPEGGSEEPTGPSVLYGDDVMRIL